MGRDTDDDLDQVQPEDKDPVTFEQEVAARAAPAASEEKDDEANQQ